MKNESTKLRPAQIVKTLNQVKQQETKNKARRIKRANEKFAKLTPAQKRVAIAKDVLLQMNTGFIKPKSGVWADFSKELPENKPDMELQSFLETQKGCDACGLGSLFVCAVKLFDNLKVGEVIENIKQDTKEADPHGPEDDIQTDGITVKTILSYLGKFFSKDQLEKIESAFEEGGGYFSDNNEKFVQTPASISAGHYFNHINDKLCNLNEDLSTELKLKLIMQNIIKNNGTFKTDDKNKPKFTYEIVIPGFKDNI